MMINNPVTSMRLIDLLDMNNTDLFNFDYSKLYDVVGDWLSSERTQLVNDSLYDDFIKTFCDRFYSRNLNFDTFLDFKIKLRDCLRNNKEKAKRMFEAGLLEINPLNTYKHEVEHNGDNKGNRESNSTNNTESTYSNDTDVTRKYKDTHDYYKLHSDTPSDNVNLTNLVAGGTGYVTDVDNTKDVTTNESLDDHTNNKGSDTSEAKGSNKTNYEDDIYFNELQVGYDGHPVDLINKYINLNLDVVNFYMQCIEDACLFSSILY